MTRILTMAAFDELDAINNAVVALRRPSSQWRANYNTPEIRSLHRRGLITWQPGKAQGFGPKFAAVDITPLGREKLKSARDQS